ncbi:MAG: repeat protein, partial [Myxococcales bacterium]|nr:repeat protein [Myxococcales bacterium]
MSGPARRWTRAIIWVAAVAGCRGDFDVDSSVEISKVSPASVSAPEAWRLFDRSLASGFSPTDKPIEVTFDKTERVTALKVFGPAPYRLTVRGFDPIDLSALSPEWHSFQSTTIISVKSVELQFESTGPGKLVPEIELWAVDDQITTGKRDLTGRELPAGALSFAATSPSDELAAGNCLAFSVAVDRPSSQMRHAYLAYDSNGLFRPFTLQRSINGLAPQGGAWLAGDGAPRANFEEIDPAVLTTGSNEVRLCLPASATRNTTISNLRIVAELDRGIGLASSVEVGADHRDGTALLDRDSKTEMQIAAGERVAIAFDRFIAPDALVVSGRGLQRASIECVGKAGLSHALVAPLRATTIGAVFKFSAGGLACSELGVIFDSPVTLTDLDVIGSGAGESVDWPRTVVTSPSEHFGTSAWVGGFIARPPVMTGAIRVDIGGQAADAMTGDFGRLLVRTDKAAASWPVTVGAHFPDGSSQLHQLLLDQDHGQQLTPNGTRATAAAATVKLPDSRFGQEGDSIVVRAPTAAPSKIRLGTGVGVDVPAGAVLQPTNITVRHLGEDVLPPLDAGMINVTAPQGHGFEFLPHGQRFARPVEVVVPFDPRLIPEGMTAEDVNTFYFDPKDEKWKKLPRHAIDMGDHVTRSATDHFTIMIDAVLAVPKNPSPLSLDPTALTSIGAASPAANIDLIEPPQSNSTGDARLSLPIRVPKGRGAYTPSLGIGYSSSAGNGWLGVGWDLSVSKIEIDTRWGVPTYADDEDPRYVLDGSELVPTLETEGPSCQAGQTGRRYHARIEGAFTHILRCSENSIPHKASSYHWEAHDRDGTLFVYGTHDAETRNPQSHTYTGPRGTFRWNLQRVVDVHGNTTTFHYQPDEIANVVIDPSRAIEPSRELYPTSIDYTSHTSNSDAPYSISFELDDGSRLDHIVSGRLGFKSITRHLLRAVHVTFHGAVIRDYVLTYTHGQFDKSLLSSVKVYGVGGCAASGDAFSPPGCTSAAFLDEHRFDYFSETAGFTAPVPWRVEGTPASSDAALGEGSSGALSESAGLTISHTVSVGLNHSGGERNEHIGIYDVNGDGLPDQVYTAFTSTGPTTTVLYNQTRRGIDHNVSPLFAATEMGTKGLPFLGAESTSTWGVSLGGAFGKGALTASVSAGASSSTTESKRFLTDLNGDGFLDVVNAEGPSQLGHPCPEGTCFTSTAFGATAAVDPKTDPLLLGFAKDIKARGLVADPVVQWVAPFEGTVTISGTAQKRVPGGDGVAVELYQGDTLISAIPIAPDDTTSVTFAAPASVHVSPGDAIYMRAVAGADDGVDLDGTLHDALDTRLDVQYVSACTDLGCGDVVDPVAARQPTGEPVFAFDSHDDFRLANQPAPLAITVPGVLELHAQLTQEHAAIADLTVCVQRFTSSAFFPHLTLDQPCDSTDPSVAILATYPLPAGAGSSLPIELSIPVQAGQLVLVRVEAPLSFDPAPVHLVPLTTGQPVVSYSEACMPTFHGVFLCSTDPKVIAGVPLISAGLDAFVKVRTEPAAMPFVAPTAGSLDVQDFDAPTEPFVFAARSPEQGILAYQDCRTVSCGPTIHVPSFGVSAGESITFELVTASGAGGPSNFQVQLNGVIASPLAVEALTATPVSTPFAGGYHGFRAGFWNEAMTFAPDQLLEDLNNPFAMPPIRKQQIAGSFIPPRPLPAGSPAIGLAPAWIASGSPAFISATAMNAASNGFLFGAAGGGLFGGKYARLSGTSSLYFGAGVQAFSVFGLDLNVSHSETNTSTDVVDMNGDGVGDVIHARGIALGLFATGSTPASGFELAGSFRHRSGIEYGIGFGEDVPVMRVTTSNGRSLSVSNPQGADTGILGLSAGVGLGIGRSETTQDLIDVNGDGLPDVVRRDGPSVRVRLNLGNRFGIEEPFGQDLESDDTDTFETTIEHASHSFGALDSTHDALQHDTTLTQTLTGGFKLPGILDCSVSGRFTSSRTTRQIADINGDGLPDLLFKKPGDNIYVQFGRGGDFSPPVPWTTPAWLGAISGPFSSEVGGHLDALGVTGDDVLAGTGSQSGGSGGCSVNLPIVPGILDLHLDASVSSDTDTYELALLDVDGDGAADHMLRREDTGKVFVKHNQITGKTNLLQAVYRPLGGAVSLDYTRIGNTVDMPHSREVLTSVTVDDGVDLGSDFASPNLVTQMTYEGGYFQRDEKEFFGFAKVTTTRADGVTVEDDYENQTFTLHGQLQRETRRDSAQRMFHDHQITRELRDVLDANGVPVMLDPSCIAHLSPLLLEVDGACTPKFAVVTRDDDTRSEGGAASKTRTVQDTEHDRFGNVLFSTDGVDDAIASDDIAARAHYSNDTAAWMLGRSTSLDVRAGNSAGTLLRSRTGEYNPEGELTAVHVSTGAGIATTQLSYDAFGNLAHVTTPPNENGQSQTFDVTYDTDVQTYPASMTDGFGYTSTAQYDVRFGVATSEVDLNGATMTRTLDAFGRLSTVRGPYDTAGPALAMEYHPEERPARAVTVTRASAPADYTGPVPAPTTTVTLADGLGRAIELRRTAVVDGVTGMTSSGLVAQDSVGRTIKTYNPFFTPGASTSFVTPAITLATQMAYDCLDRPVQTTYADLATETASFEITTAPGGSTLFLLRIVDPNGHPREAFLDYAGRTRAFVEHPTATNSSTTTYDYLATGELSHIVDADANETTLAYDLRGLRTFLNNPDDGLIENQYDLMGNRIALIEPNHRALGTRVHYVYDRDRLATVDYPSKPDVTFTYGAPGAASFRAGRITQVQDESGSQQHFYGALGEMRRTIRTVVPAQQGSQSVVFDLHLVTDSLGRQLQIGYPDGEVVTNQYDAAGMLAQVAGVGTGWSRTYVSGLRYDVFGNRTRAQFGNGDVTTRTFDPMRVRLQSLTTTLSSAAKIQDLHYAYDPASNPTEIHNDLAGLNGGSKNMPGLSTLTLTYDGVDRLTRSVGSAQLSAQKTTSYDQGFTYSASHNILHKQRVHLISNNSGIPTTPVATNFASDYTYGTSRPHLPTRIGSLDITYDASGNPLTRNKVGTGSQQTLVWDDDNRMVDATSGSVHQHNTYDASGTRVRRKSTQSETIFSSQYFDLDNGTQGTKHVFAGATRVASELAKFASGTNQVAPATPGTVYYFHQDHLGSTSVVTDETGSVQESLEYFSDGETWIDRAPQKPINGYLFSGKPFDPDTGFYDYGQRFYDPRTSLWLGLDSTFSDSPNSSVGRPGYLSPITFSALSPSRLKDTNGKDWVVADAGSLAPHIVIWVESASDYEDMSRYFSAWAKGPMNGGSVMSYPINRQTRPRGFVESVADGYSLMGGMGPDQG